MERTLLAFLRSLREANFVMYKQLLGELIVYFFANSNVNYASWLPVHLQDMMSSERMHPEVADAFQVGNFVVYHQQAVCSYGN